MGDVIYIEANSGAVKRVGRCDAYATEFDLEAEEYVPLPKVWPSFSNSRALCSMCTITICWAFPSADSQICAAVMLPLAAAKWAQKEGASAVYNTKLAASDTQQQCVCLP